MKPDFFQVSGSGGTVASAGLRQGARDHGRALQPRPQQHLPLLCLRRRQRGERCRADARSALAAITADTCYTGYVEVSSGVSRQLDTETGRLFAELTSAGCAAGSYALNDFDDVWGGGAAFLLGRERGGAPAA